MLKRSSIAFTARRLCSALAACLILATGLAIPDASAAEDVVVIVNVDNPNVIDRAYVIKIYTGAVKGWPDGTPVFSLDYEQDSEARKTFYATVLGKSAAAMRAIWSQNIFTGKGLPPKVTTEDGEMKRIVAANRNAIGYIRASHLDRSVKVIDR